MTPRKRKADPTSLAESSDGSPHKRIRSESTNDTDNRQNGNNHTSNESSDDYTENSIHVAKPSRSVPAASSKENEDALLGDLPQSWDEASAADKLLVKIKMEKGKHSWAQIEKLWERLAGKKPAKDTLSDRYRRLKDIMAHKKPGAASGVKIDPEVVEEPLEISAGISTFPTTEVRPSSRSIGGPPNKSPHAFSKGPMTAAKTSDPASSAPSARSSRAISNRSKATTKRSKHASAAPDSEVSPRQDLPQSWDQADAGDQLIVSMKTSRIGWSKIEEAWQRLTGERPAEGALQDRYTRIKELVIRPGTHGAYTYKNPKLELGTPRKRKAKAELSEQSSDQTSDQSSDESSNESSDGFSKQSITMARRKPRDAIRQQTRASAYDGQSDEPISKGTKLTTEDPSNGRADTGSSDESDEVSKHSTSVIKSAKRRHGKHAFAADSGAQNTAETANDMLVEMRERGCTWVEISQAWNERTGLTHVPETLRKRYARIKKGSATQLKSLTQVSNKRKVIAVSPDEGSYEPSAKRSKSTAETSRVAETPTKRNVDRGKRKSSVKYTDSTTDEDEIFSAPAEPISTAPARRTAGRSAKVNRSDPEWLVTNEKSPLADEDLHAEFSDPKTYEDFTRSDWEDLREVLPHDVPINPDGYSIPMEFFKYDPDFRRGLREFQEDLALGRLDPTWQADAAQAMEERARGEFDAYKENQFEAFWGQKQKLNHDALAGESTKIKLDLLIQNEMFRVGDYFSYSRVFGRGKNGVLVEKDCKIVEVDGKALTFAIPPGHRKYSRRMFETGPPGNTKPRATETTAGGDDQPPSGVGSQPGAVRVVEDTDADDDEASEHSDGALAVGKTAEDGNLPDSSKAQEVDLTLENKTNMYDAAEAINSESTEVEADNKPQDNGIHGSTASGIVPNGASSQMNDGHSSTPALQEEDVLHNVSNLRQLEDKIVDIDGRFKSKDLAATSPWKHFRGIRNNQDLGTLFEMREEFYVYKHPQIVKEAKKKR